MKLAIFGVRDAGYVKEQVERNTGGLWEVVILADNKEELWDTEMDLSENKKVKIISCQALSERYHRGERQPISGCNGGMPCRISRLWYIKCRPRKEYNIGGGYICGCYFQSYLQFLRRLPLYWQKSVLRGLIPILPQRYEPLWWFLCHGGWSF